MEKEIILRKCTDCGELFERSDEYCNQNRTDPFFKYKLQHCDSCADKYVEKAFERMSGIINILSTDYETDN